MPETQEEKKKNSWIIYTVVIALVLVGLYIARRTHLFSREHDYYAYYSNIKGLQASSPVMMRGVRVGKISDIKLTDSGKVLVKLTIKKDVELHNGTIALIASGGLMGDKIIRLTPGNESGFIPEYSIIESSYDTSVLEMSVRLSPYVDIASGALHNMDTNLLKLNNRLKGPLGNTIEATLLKYQNLFTGYAHKSAAWDNKVASYEAPFANAERSSANMAENSKHLPSSLSNTARKTNELANKPITQNVQSIQSSIKSLNNSFSALNNSTKKGNWLSDKSNYHSLSNNMDTLSQNWKETQRSPKGFVIFGGKKKK